MKLLKEFLPCFTVILNGIEYYSTQVFMVINGKYTTDTKADYFSSKDK